jgi:hypothetical protein
VLQPIASRSVSHPLSSPSATRQAPPAAFLREERAASAAQSVRPDQMRNWARNLFGNQPSAHLQQVKQENARLSASIQALFERTKESGPGGSRHFEFMFNARRAAIIGTSHHQMINANAGQAQVSIQNGKPARINSGIRSDFELHALLEATENALRQRVGA